MRGLAAQRARREQELTAALQRQAEYLSRETDEQEAKCAAVAQALRLRAERAEHAARERKAANARLRAESLLAQVASSRAQAQETVAHDALARVRARLAPAQQPGTPG